MSKYKRPIWTYIKPKQNEELIPNSELWYFYEYLVNDTVSHKDTRPFLKRQNLKFDGRLPLIGLFFKDQAGRKLNLSVEKLDIAAQQWISQGVIYLLGRLNEHCQIYQVGIWSQYIKKNSSATKAYLMKKILFLKRDTHESWLKSISIGGYND